MENNIDLTLRNIHGIAWRSGGLCGGYNGSAAWSGIKAYVSFSGSIPNMKVSSFAMCPESGSLVIESNTPKLISVEEEEKELTSEKRQLLEITFTDPFQEKTPNQKVSSNNSSSSEISSSSYRPHLQFNLRGGNNNDGYDVQASSDDDKPDSRHHKILKLHIVFRSADGGVIAEGVAIPRLPENNFDGLPLILDLPITQITKNNLTNIAEAGATKLSQIFFGESACIRVHLDDSTNHQNVFSSQSTAPNEFDLSDNVDEIQLGGMVKKIHEREDMQKVRFDATKSNLFRSGNKNAGKRRIWAFGCSGAMDINHSIQSFFDVVRGFRTKCVDPEDRELFTNTTMTSTIVTRESLEI